MSVCAGDDNHATRSRPPRADHTAHMMKSAPLPPARHPTCVILRTRCLIKNPHQRSRHTDFFNRKGRKQVCSIRSKGRKAVLTPINNLSDRVALELVRKPILFTHLTSLLASKITKQGVYKSRGYSTATAPLFKVIQLEALRLRSLSVLREGAHDIRAEKHSLRTGHHAERR
ncbi:MAG: hypothetical protein JWS10_595 [Cypionkella sp.]|nr:hypothetical protein [Cypionkella sp.]